MNNKKFLEGINVKRSEDLTPQMREFLISLANGELNTGKIRKAVSLKIQKIAHKNARHQILKEFYDHAQYYGYPSARRHYVEYGLIGCVIANMVWSLKMEEEESFA